MDAFAFLERAAKGDPQPVYVLHGDDDFLKRQVVAALRQRVLGADDDGFGLATHVGDKATLAAIRDDIDTVAFLGGRRLVVVEQADPFISACRAQLEKWLPTCTGPNVLVLVVGTWAANTRLYKVLDGPGSIVCKGPAASRLPDWCVSWAESAHGKQLAAPAARLLVDLVGPELGLLDQELAKLAVYVGDKSSISEDDVDALVGRSRAANVFKILVAVASGRPGEALAILDRLFDQGEEPLRVLGALSAQLRKLAQAARLAQTGTRLPDALKLVGVPPFALQEADQQLRHLGRRANHIYDWLLETDAGLKGASQLPPRVLLERLVLRLAAAS
jgi:DNA polymerase-3 subunit delta